jgi:hypothetical protein
MSLPAFEAATTALHGRGSTGPGLKMSDSISTRTKWWILSIFERQIDTIITERILKYHWRQRAILYSSAADNCQPNLSFPPNGTAHPMLDQCEHTTG